MSYFYIFGTVSAHASQTVGTLVGDAENAGVDNAGVDNVAPSSRGGKTRWQES